MKATIGGKLAQLGQRLVDGAAKKMADEFFDKFSELAGGKVKPPVVVEAKVAKSPAPANDNRGSSFFEPPSWLPIAIIATAIVLMLVVLLR